MHEKFGLFVHLGTIIWWHKSEKVKKNTCGCMFVSKEMLNLSHLTFPPPTLVLLSRMCACCRVTHWSDTSFIFKLAAWSILLSLPPLWSMVHFVKPLCGYWEISDVKAVGKCLQAARSQWRREHAGGGKTKDMRWVITPSFLIAVIQNVRHIHLYSPFQVT